MKRTVVFGMLGTTVDAGRGPKRWERWRPTVAICQQPDLQIDQFELLVNHVPREHRSLTADIIADIAVASPATNVVTHELPFRDAWDFAEVYGALFDFAERYPFDLATCEYYVHITTGTHVAQICLFLLCETRVLPAKLMQSSPGFGPKRTPQGDIAIIDLDLTKYSKLAARAQAKHRDRQSALKAGIATQNPAFNAMIDELSHIAARSADPILLGGATGTGKSVLAERVYEQKRKQHQLQGAFVSVNCATLRGDGAMSALFGHVKGAFTGAAEARSGYLRKADAGLLFLDEIGELGLDEQAMLLTALERREFYPVGSDKTVRSNFQLIAGSNRDLRAEILAGRFRDDLFARISTWTFRLPSLGERREDIAPNIDYELGRLSTQLGVNVTFAKAARAKFLAYATSDQASWPGNFRDFGAAMRRMATLAQGGRIEMADVEREVSRLSAARLVPAAAAQPVGPIELTADALGGVAPASLDHFDAVQLAAVVAACRRCPSLSAAGRELFGASRQTRKQANDADRLRKYLARFGLTFDRLRPA